MKWRSCCICPQALGVNARRGCQDTIDQTGWRLHLREFLQPVAARLSFGEQRPAGGASPRMGLETVESRPAQNAVKRVREQGIELVALHPVTGLFWHHITCLYVRCSRRASSARPRFIRDFTVPSG